MCRLVGERPVEESKLYMVYRLHSTMWMTTCTVHTIFYWYKIVYIDLIPAVRLLYSFLSIFEWYTIAWGCVCGQSNEWINDHTQIPIILHLNFIQHISMKWATVLTNPDDLISRTCLYVQWQLRHWIELTSMPSGWINIEWINDTTNSTVSMKSPGNSLHQLNS